MYKVVIIDDEILARKALRKLLEKYSQIEIIGEADCVKSALDIIKESNPNLLFLDIQMPGETGFDLINKIEYQGLVIFVTAYDEYAIRAFEINALDYLLKPISPERLEISIERLERINDNSKIQEEQLSYYDQLFTLMGKGMVFLKISSIICIHAEGDYTKVYTSEGRHGLILKSMKEWEQRLPHNSFIRIHRKYIINLNYVEKIEKEINYEFSVILKGFDGYLSMSRRYAKKLRERMG